MVRLDASERVPERGGGLLEGHAMLGTVETILDRVPFDIAPPWAR